VTFSRRFSLVKFRRLFEGYLLLLPFLILFIIFIIWPIGQSLYLSFTKFNGLKAPSFIGLENFKILFADARFHKALLNTSTYVLLSVIITNILGLCLALAFRANTWLNYLMRTLLFLPSVTSSIAITVLWTWMFAGESYGLLNAIRRSLGLESISFLSTPSLSIPVIVVLAVWGGMGYSMVLFLAGLNAVPGELNEAAAIDGANVTQRFWNITFPLLRPTLLYVIITGIIGAFQIFDSAYILFATPEGIGGVLDSALFVVPYLYEQGFTFFKLGLASAIAWFLFIIIFIITLINLGIGRINTAD
jgi:multiple sugar transport system permease protein